jgi:phosphatidyl-myo-inositol alpha-mannosyltransferase
VRLGIVCPYSLDVPGGVGWHCRDLAERLVATGHEVSVLAPADDDSALPPYVVAAGRAGPVRYNGSVARVNFGPVSAARTRRWLDDGGFEVVHIHEPVSPSLSLLALWAAEGPIVATFHTSNLRSRAMQTAYPLLRPSLEKISARIAVSEDARRTVTNHIGGDAIVIPNGVYVDRFASAATRSDWQGTADAPTVAFVGRIDEPRKGLDVLVQALPDALRAIPGLRVLVAGAGDVDEARAGLPPDLSRACSFVGQLSDADKASLLRSVDLYVAPHTGGESFGIVLIEAMSAGAPVLASDLPAFRRVLEDGACGELVPTGVPQAQAGAMVGLLTDPTRRSELAARGRLAVTRYDWSVVARQIVDVYETVAS